MGKRMGFRRRSSWPRGSVESTRSGSAAFSRFPQIRSAASQITITASHGLIVDAPTLHGMRCAFIAVEFTKQPDAELAVGGADYIPTGVLIFPSNTNTLWNGVAFAAGLQLTDRGKDVTAPEMEERLDRQSA